MRRREKEEKMIGKSLFTKHIIMNIIKFLCRFFEKYCNISNQSNTKFNPVGEESGIVAKVDKLENIVKNTFENSHELLNNTIALLENRLKIKERENSTLLEIIEKMNRDKPQQNLKKDIYGNQKESKNGFIAAIEDCKNYDLEREIGNTRKSVHKEDISMLLEYSKLEELESQITDDKLGMKVISDLKPLSVKKVNMLGLSWTNLSSNWDGLYFN